MPNFRIRLSNVIAWGGFVSLICAGVYLLVSLFFFVDYQDAKDELAEMDALAAEVETMIAAKDAMNCNEDEGPCWRGRPLDPPFLTEFKEETRPKFASALLRKKRPVESAFALSVLCLSGWLGIGILNYLLLGRLRLLPWRREYFTLSEKE